MRPSRRPMWVSIAATAALVCGAALAGPSAQATRPSPTAKAAPVSSSRAASSSRVSGAAARGVVIENVTIDVPYGPDVTAYVVRPSGRQAPGSDAGILFLHWLGQIHSDRTEYLAEAVALAGKGVVSVLPEGTFPWTQAPVGHSQDAVTVQHQVAAFKAALDTLAAIPAVDPARIALVGHDYGAMYGALLADEDARVSVLVLETPDATWGNWFAKYWLNLHGDQRARYLAFFQGLDPVEHTARLGGHVLFQWAGKDIYVAKRVQSRFAATSPDAQVELYPNSDHQLTDQAAADRDSFLAAQLELGS